VRVCGGGGERRCGPHEGAHLLPLHGTDVAHSTEGALPPAHKQKTYARKSLWPIMMVATCGIHLEGDQLDPGADARVLPHTSPISLENLGSCPLRRVGSRNAPVQATNRHSASSVRQI
jgi:hypothetical protein